MIDYSRININSTLLNGHMGTYEYANQQWMLPGTYNKMP